MRQLRKLALVTMRDSAHGRRRGQRGDQGQIVSAYGIDLSPPARAFEEIKAAAEAHTAFSRLDKLGRQEIGRIRRIVSQALAQAADLGLVGKHWTVLHDEIEAVAAAASVARMTRDHGAYSDALRVYGARRAGW